MVTNEAQLENALYGDHNAIFVLHPKVATVLSSTVFGAYVSQLECVLSKDKNWMLVNTTVFGGVKRASTGVFKTMASLTNHPLRNVGLILSDLSLSCFTQ